MANLSEDQKVFLLLHYERLLVKMEKLEPANATVEGLCQSFNVNKNYARKLRDQFFERGTLDRKQGSGRHSIANYAKRRAAVSATIRKHRSSNISDISNVTKILISSVQRIVVAEQFRLVHRKICPLITDVQKGKRLKWCRQHRHNTWDAWVDIDEK